MSKNIWISKDMGNGVRVGTNVSVESLFLGYGALVVLALVAVAGLWSYNYLYPDCKEDDIECFQKLVAKDLAETIKAENGDPLLKYRRLSLEVDAYEHSKNKYDGLMKKLVDEGNLNSEDRKFVEKHEMLGLVFTNRDKDYAQNKQYVTKYEATRNQINEVKQQQIAFEDQKRKEAYVEKHSTSQENTHKEIMGPPTPHDIKRLPQQTQENRQPKTQAIPEVKPRDDKLNEDLYRG